MNTLDISHQEFSTVFNSIPEIGNVYQNNFYIHFIHPSLNFAGRPMQTGEEGGPRQPDSSHEEGERGIRPRQHW